MNAEAIADSLGGKKSGAGFIARCPAHPDKNPSLSINQSSDGKVLVHCFSGCSQEAVLAALPQRQKTERPRDVQPTYKKVAQYFYQNENGENALRVDRLESGTEKTFRQFHKEWGQWLPGGTKTSLRPYRYNEWMNLDSVALAEGEKVVEALVKAGIQATTTPGGASSWKPHYAQFFRNKTVLIFPDKDDAGEKYVQQAFRDIRSEAKTIKVIRFDELSKGEDVADYLERHSPEDLQKKIEMTPETLDISSISVTEEKTRERPRPLFREMQPPEDYPLEHLGAILGNAARQIHAVIQAPEGLCGQSVLAAAALAVQGHRDMLIDGRRFPVSLFCLTVGNSGERKSQVDKQALRSHREFERALVSKYQEANLLYEEESHIHKELRAKATLNKKSSHAELKLALQELGHPPEKPLQPFIISQDPTIEGLEKGFQVGQPSQGVFSDEGGRIIGGYGMKAENAMKTISGFCDFWDGGKPLTRNRGGDGSSIQYEKRLSLHLLATPIVAQEVLSSPLMTQQGFLARCLISWPTSKMGERAYLERDLTTTPEMNVYWAKTRETLETKFEIQEGSRNELNTRVLELTPIAKKLFIEFHDWIEKNLSRDGLYGNIQSFAAKAAEHCARIAGVLTAFENLAADRVNDEILSAAIELTNYYLNETLRVFHSSGVHPDLALAEKTRIWISQFEFIHPVKIYRFGPNSIRDSEKARKMIQILEDHGWLMKTKCPMELDGSLRRDVWKVIK